MQGIDWSRATGASPQTPGKGFTLSTPTKGRCPLDTRQGGVPPPAPPGEGECERCNDASFHKNYFSKIFFSQPRKEKSFLILFFLRRIDMESQFLFIMAVIFIIALLCECRSPEADPYQLIEQYPVYEVLVNFRYNGNAVSHLLPGHWDSNTGQMIVGVSLPMILDDLHSENEYRQDLWWTEEPECHEQACNSGYTMNFS